MYDSVPALGLLIDLPLGLIMWAAIFRFLLTIFITENSQFVGLRIVVLITDPFVRLIRRMTPPWIMERLTPLVTAFAVFILRYYLTPLIVGYDMPGFSQMPLESLILSVRGEVGL